MKDRYRFDDAYEKVYAYDESYSAYIFIGTYFAYSITAKMPINKKIELIELVEA